LKFSNEMTRIQSMQLGYKGNVKRRDAPETQETVSCNHCIYWRRSNFGSKRF